MKSDLDAIMQENGIDALLVTGAGFHNPAMVYLTGGGHMTQADLFKKRGEPAVLFCAPMERDEAAKTGLETRSYSAYPIKDLLQESGGDFNRAFGLRYVRILTDLGLTAGRVAVYGQIEVGGMIAALPVIREKLPDLKIVGYAKDPIFLRAMLTKDEGEIERIRRISQITTQVVGQVAEFLTHHPVKDGVLVRADGQPLTIGDVKNQINLWLAEKGADNPEATIFAIGRDAGVPHSTGNPEEALRLGVPIVFDFFPCEGGGGYFSDFTRTWCLGYAPDDVRHIYDQVKYVYDQVVSELTVNTPFKKYQERTCEMFAEMGHPTIDQDPTTEVGYVHSLGHGVGLHIHEKPFSGSNADEADILAPGSVFTIEPGLYYPDKGIGVRLEDTYWVTPEGKIEALTHYPMDLVLPMQS
ncbi:MAG TPA: M24 family metallopeptidase [Anaerolineaceae bacterium]|nr:M24 family metallopeptidase [Anaerolineaceae bacterium]